MDERLPQVIEEGLDDRGSYLPLSFIPGKPVNPSELSKPTPDHKKRYLDLGNGRGYYYVEIGYVIERLNAAFGPGRWVFRRDSVSALPPDEKGQVEVIVEGVLLAPGLPTCGIPGMGSDKYMPQNPLDSKANTVLSAQSAAIKNAARFLGVGLDIRDNPKEGAQIEGRQMTIQTLYEQLVNAGLSKDAEKIVTKYAPQAIDQETKKLVAFFITEDQLDLVYRAFIQLAKGIQ